MQIQGHRLPGRLKPPVPLIVQTKYHSNNTVMGCRLGVVPPGLVALGRGEPATVGPGSGTTGTPLDPFSSPIRTDGEALGSFPEDRGARGHEAGAFPLAPDSRLLLSGVRSTRRVARLEASGSSVTHATGNRHHLHRGHGRIRRFIDSQIPAYFPFLIHG
jgi:hypothetical protein